MNIQEKLGIIANILSIEKNVTFNLDDQYSIELFIGDTVVYKLFVDNIPTNIKLTRKLIEEISSEEELNDLIDLISKQLSKYQFMSIYNKPLL